MACAIAGCRGRRGRARPRHAGRGHRAVPVRAAVRAVGVRLREPAGPEVHPRHHRPAPRSPRAAGVAPGGVAPPPIVSHLMLLPTPTLWDATSGRLSPAPEVTTLEPTPLTCPPYVPRPPPPRSGDRQYQWGQCRYFALGFRLVRHHSGAMSSNLKKKAANANSWKKMFHGWRVMKKLQRLLLRRLLHQWGGQALHVVILVQRHFHPSHTVGHRF